MSIKFSVLLPTKNRLELLKSAIWSVREQNYDNWEIIVADNCSQEDIKGYLDSLNDERIIYTRSDVPLSVTDNWNKSLVPATGDYIVMIGDDDALLPNYFTRCLEVIEQFENPDFLIYAGFIWGHANVLDKVPSGFLYDTKKNTHFLNNINKPEIFSLRHREYLAKLSLLVKSAYSFNMQYTLYNKNFINLLKEYGEFFQPPFPDFYTTNLAMLKASKAVIVPEILVVTGITNKSYGYFYYNKKEKEGMDKLHKEADFRDFALPSIKKYLCEISEQDDAELTTMAVLQSKFPQRDDLKLGIDNYLKNQIRLVFKEFNIFKAIQLYFSVIYPKLNEKLKKQSLKIIFGALIEKIKNEDPYKGLRVPPYNTVEEFYRAVERGEISRV